MEHSKLRQILQGGSKINIPFFVVLCTETPQVMQMWGRRESARGKGNGVVTRRDFFLSFFVLLLSFEPIGLGTQRVVVVLLLLVTEMKFVGIVEMPFKDQFLIANIPDGTFKLYKPNKFIKIIVILCGILMTCSIALQDC